MQESLYTLKTYIIQSFVWCRSFYVYMYRSVDNAREKTTHYSGNAKILSNGSPLAQRLETTITENAGKRASVIDPVFLVEFEESLVAVRLRYVPFFGRTIDKKAGQKRVKNFAKILKAL